MLLGAREWLVGLFIVCCLRGRDVDLKSIDERFEGYIMWRKGGREGVSE